MSSGKIRRIASKIGEVSDYEFDVIYESDRDLGDIMMKAYKIKKSIDKLRSKDSDFLAYKKNIDQLVRSVVDAKKIYDKVTR